MLSPKSNDSLTVADRMQLLQQRMRGVDDVSSNSLSILDSSASQGSSSDQVQPHLRITDCQVKSSGERPKHEMTLNIDREMKMREDYEAKLAKMRKYAASILEKYAQAKFRDDEREILDSQSRLGTITPAISGTLQWVGGYEIDRLDREILELSEKIDHIESNSDDMIMRKSFLNYRQMELKRQRKQLDDERQNTAVKWRLLGDMKLSQFKPGQSLDGGKYVLIEYIGRGGFSEVWLAADVSECRNVAIKIQKMNPQWPVNVRENFTKHMGREIRILRNANHVNVVGFYGHFFIEDNTLAMVMEHCSGGDLSMLIHKRGRLPEKEARYIFTQIVSGLLALRKEGNSVIHYDLKPANILFSENGVVKITDFGLSKIVKDAENSIELTSQGTGTYYYAAPETFQRAASVKITSAVDTWSLGIILYEMLYGQRPFGEETTQKSFALHVDCLTEKIVFPATVKISNACKDFIQTCLERDPSIRPELCELMSHRYFRN